MQTGKYKGLYQKDTYSKFSLFKNKKFLKSDVHSLLIDKKNHLFI